ncbi:MAG: L-arabinose isomerase [Cyclobacteriaceae bacterium]
MSNSIIPNLKSFEVWFVSGSQHLYGEEALAQVAAHAQTVAMSLNDSTSIPVQVVYKQVLTTPDEIAKLCLDANASHNCIGIIAWMHTFSPAKMWIRGLQILRKPLCHLHTQFNRDIPWASINMDFMNLNQSAHGGREFGFMISRMRKDRKVVTGHWQDVQVQQSVGTWTRAAAGWHDLQGAKVARFGDNMREVAVTEGDKVEAQMRLGFSVNGYGMGDLVAFVNQVSDAEVLKLVQEYEESYNLADSLKEGETYRASLLEAARIELGMRFFLEDGGFKAYTDTFENSHGITQLPGIASQRLMDMGYGFGGEGDWKTAALLRSMKVMDSGLVGGTSFMEDYTYHLHPDGQRVLGSHMLEICPSIANGKASCEIHPLSIGGKSDPVRLVFNVGAGPAINASVMDMGNRFRLLVNEVQVEDPTEALPQLPVARVLWNPKPDLKTAATTWIHGGGAHHTVFSKALNTEYMEDFAAIAGIELLVIDQQTTVRDFRDKLHWNEVYYHVFHSIN